MFTLIPWLHCESATTCAIFVYVLGVTSVNFNIIRLCLVYSRALRTRVARFFRVQIAYQVYQQRQKSPILFFSHDCVVLWCCGVWYQWKGLDEQNLIKMKERFSEHYSKTSVKRYPRGMENKYTSAGVFEEKCKFK